MEAERERGRMLPHVVGPRRYVGDEPARCGLPRKFLATDTVTVGSPGWWPCACLGARYLSPSPLLRSPSLLTASGYGSRRCRSTRRAPGKAAPLRTPPQVGRRRPRTTPRRRQRRRRRQDLGPLPAAGRRRPAAGGRPQRLAAAAERPAPAWSGEVTPPAPSSSEQPCSCFFSPGAWLRFSALSFRVPARLRLPRCDRTTPSCDR